MQCVVWQVRQGTRSCSSSGRDPRLWPTSSVNTSEKRTYLLPPCFQKAPPWTNPSAWASLKVHFSPDPFPKLKHKHAHIPCHPHKCAHTQRQTPLPLASRPLPALLFFPRDAREDLLGVTLRIFLLYGVDQSDFLTSKISEFIGQWTGSLPMSFPKRAVGLKPVFDGQNEYFWEVTPEDLKVCSNRINHGYALQ